jgi:hypothetical protein
MRAPMGHVLVPPRFAMIASCAGPGMQRKLGSGIDGLYSVGSGNGEAKMLRVASAFGLALLTCQPAFADGWTYSRHRYYHRHYLPRERHVIEVVQPPYSGIFIINGIRFTGMTPACLRWAAGERIKLISGDWHGHCVTATFYNFRRHSTCQTWCRAVH